MAATLKLALEFAREEGTMDAYGTSHLGPSSAIVKTLAIAFRGEAVFRRP